MDAFNKAISLPPKPSPFEGKDECGGNKKECIDSCPFFTLPLPSSFGILMATMLPKKARELAIKECS